MENGSFNGKTMGKPWENDGTWRFITSGKRSHNELENHHAIQGQTHDFNGHFQ